MLTYIEKQTDRQTDKHTDTTYTDKWGNEARRDPEVMSKDMVLTNCQQGQQTPANKGNT